MGKTADELAKGIKVESVATEFRKIVEELEKKANAEEPIVIETGVNGNPLIIDPEAELALNASQIIKGEVSEVPTTDPASTTETQPQAIVEASRPMPEGTTADEDVRAPLVVPLVQPKTPRKPLINWSKIGKQLEEAGTVLRKGFEVAGKWASEAVGFMFTIVVVLGYLLIQTVPALFYLMGMVTAYLKRSFMNGYNGHPLMEPGDHPGKHMDNILPFKKPS